ncbi:mannose-1-phosphate guanylyltransferase [Roseisolibacter sp. H3M3-2]|uniref:mannose-1-phosphate guanylyltransferase n=1 Tax=Roseisolibacter sp. H3M3-2 TaxID=3031323 RepID=UPI0023DC185F|nr:mannose-1-phosphate guanylyltransferase [Roseisolibacter sp. H3M3-2]MDF1502526.1 mannose-1-phosphate guanylyltransferase [Roseisolibacter sp. H3M3-2]
MSTWAVILAGGVGSRFWPLSTPARPKQLLPLVDGEPLLANTLARLAPLVPAEHTLVLTNASLVAPIRALAPELPAENVIAEPARAGTAAARAVSTREVARRVDGDAVMLCVHADWAIGDADGFRATLQAAARAAAAHRSLVTVGIVPTRDDPGFGYIQPGDAVEPGVHRVARFVEKPSRERAARMRADGFLWNSGIFAWRSGDFLAEVEARCPEVAPALRAAGDRADDAAIRDFFADVTPVAVDVGVMERSDRVLVLPGDFGWDDVGTWGALSRVRALDADGNAASGATHLLDARRNVVHADGNAVVLYGVEGLVVVTGPGLTLVTTVDRSSDLKTLLDTLPRDLAAGG